MDVKLAITQFDIELGHQNTQSDKVGPSLSGDIPGLSWCKARLIPGGFTCSEDGSQTQLALFKMRPMRSTRCRLSGHAERYLRHDRRPDAVFGAGQFYQGSRRRLGKRGNGSATSAGRIRVVSNLFRGRRHSGRRILLASGVRGLSRCRRGSGRESNHGRGQCRGLGSHGERRNL